MRCKLLLLGAGLTPAICSAAVTACKVEDDPWLKAIEWDDESHVARATSPRDEDFLGKVISIEVADKSQKIVLFIKYVDIMNDIHGFDYVLFESADGFEVMGTAYVKRDGQVFEKGLWTKSRATCTRF
jgi:hypothetical protein